ncbi:MAG: hypothetical protein DIJKHBIC_02782 [Thermoanaerobaculia bacterium]|nr:hypothetical protein [Thermoanaerobaculia bacterium]
MIRQALLVILAAATGSAALAGDPEPLTYRFDEVKSKVMRAPGGDEKKEARVEAGETAAGGDHVRTGFWAKAVLSVPERSSRFEISSSTRVRLQGDEPGVLLVLEKGKLKAIFDALTGGATVERKVAAPGAMLAVRGTRYGLEVGDDGETLLAVFEGTVEVLPTSPGLGPARVKADEFCFFGPRMAPRPQPMRERGMTEKSWGRREAGPPPGPDGRSGGPNQQGGPNQPGGGPSSRGTGPGMGPPGGPGQGPGGQSPGGPSGGGPSKPRTE